MGINQYLVTQRNRQWRILCQAREIVPSVSRQAAIETAVDMAKRDFRAGAPAIVLVEDGGTMTRVYDSVALVQAAQTR